MKAYVFPGQGAQYPGMGKELYERSSSSRELFETANEIIGFRITDIMFNGTEEDLRQTKVTQPAIFLHSVVLAASLSNEFQPSMVAGHSLGEFSALVSAGALSFVDGLMLVYKRALAMQKSCEKNQGAMAAILALDDEKVADICSNIDDIILPANYNCPGQIVISGTINGVERACELLKAAGAKRAIKLNVSGAFHSPLMESAKEELEDAINSTSISAPKCPVYQNVSTKGEIDPMVIKNNLIEQLTSPVRWTQSVRNMIADGADEFVEIGPGNVLQGLIKKINGEVLTSGIS